MPDQSAYSSVRARLDEIVTQVRSKDVPLEKSLDLFEEAIALGTRCAELIDRTDFSASELEAAGLLEPQGEPEPGAGSAPAGEAGAAQPASEAGEPSAANAAGTTDAADSSDAQSQDTLS
jgi:exodeoxyribonuclease VII small subunit